MAIKRQNSALINTDDNPSNQATQENNNISEINASNDDANILKDVVIGKEFESVDEQKLGYNPIPDTGGHTLHPPELYKDKGFQPAIQTTRNKGGFSQQDTEDEFDEITNPADRKNKLTEEERLKKVKKQMARPATEQDLSLLDESLILQMPEIKAATYELQSVLNPKPKDKTIRFRWVNRINNLDGNMQRMLSLGYVTASIDDIDTTRSQVSPTMIKGSTVEYYDVILMKIPVLRLMSLLKTGILKSVSRLEKVTQNGVAEANRQFISDLQNIPGAVKNYNEVKQQMGGREPVVFETTNV